MNANDFTELNVDKNKSETFHSMDKAALNLCKAYATFVFFLLCLLLSLVHAITVIQSPSIELARSIIRIIIIVERLF